MTVAALIVIGLIAGVLAAALGIGGGIVFVPALAVLLAFDQHLAEGTSLAVIMLTALIATWAHHREARVQWRTAAAVAVGTIFGAVGGAVLALRLDPDLLGRLFAIMLVIAALRLLRHTVR